MNQPKPHATTDDMDEPVSGESPETQQTDLDKQEKRKHESSENELPSSQEKNPVPPDSTEQ